MVAIVDMLESPIIKRFWPLGALFIMDGPGPENTDNAVSLLKPGKTVFHNLNIGHLLTVMKSDGANALRSAATAMALLPSSCMTHKFRRGQPRGDGHVEIDRRWS